mmetsp:Transcript_31685/g.98652  ORF Transcript_31685/g.98652 Transcript_31685/m.98652 type:complete len:226 (+) Transcript_31685:125-802(+)
MPTVDLAGRRRRGRGSSAPPSSSSADSLKSNSRHESTDSSTLLQRLDNLLKPQQGGASPSGGGSALHADSDDASSSDLEATSAAVQDRPKQHRRPPKGKRERVKRFVAHVEGLLQAAPSTSLNNIKVPAFIASDKKLQTKVMAQLGEFQVQVASGGNVVPTAQQPRRSKDRSKRVLEQGGCMPDPKGFAGPPAGSAPASSSGAVRPGAGPSMDPLWVQSRLLMSL